MTENSQTTLESLGKRIAGEIALSEEPSKIIKKWRYIFKVSQRELAEGMQVMPSVVSDYESGRRSNPGVGMVRRIVGALIDIDQKHGGKIIKEFSASESLGKFDAIVDMKEFMKSVKVGKLLRSMNTTLVAGKEFLEREINGYVVFDSKKALLNISQTDVPWVHTLTQSKAVIFTESSSGKTIMAAIKIGGFKPSCVILHGSIRMPDDLALRIANAEEIPLAISRIASLDKFLEKLKVIQ